MTACPRPRLISQRLTGTVSTNAITNEVDQVAGVESVHVDLEAKTVRVSGEGLDEQELIAAIDEAGYDVVV